MAYNEDIANRVREALASQGGVSERKMFGGLVFMVGGHMCCGVLGNELMVRVGPEQYEAAIALPHARPMDFTGRTSRNMVSVRVDGERDDDEVAAWVSRGLTFVRSLPPK